MKAIDDLKTRIFADGADRQGIEQLSKLAYIKGFTTNPTLMRKAGVLDYAAFAREVLAIVGGRPISFEVLSDDMDEMEWQARLIAGWGPNVYVKIPVTNTAGAPCDRVIGRLSAAGVRVNVTAVMTIEQVRRVAGCLVGGAPASVSVFAGRIADTGRDPVPMMAEAVEALRAAPNAELIWASPREVLNIFQADAIGCPVITVTHDILKKLPGVGKPLEQFSLETVRMFYNDARSAGFQLAPAASPTPLPTDLGPAV